jgi:chromosome segregation ATPase
VGALAWAARVAMAVPRRPREERIDPFGVGEPWRHMVTDALQARTRFEQTVASARPGPLRDRMVELGRRLDHGVEECWRIAKQGDALEAGLARLEHQSAQQELAELHREIEGADDTERPSLERARAAIESQLASAERMQRVSRDAQTRLRVLNAQMDESVARAVELAVTAHDSTDLSPLSADVESLVGELEALRLALDETAAAGGARARPAG